MQTANDFARAAQEMSRLAADMKPADTDRHAQIRRLIQYHLQSAAAKTRAVAEDLAKMEPPDAAA